jgi:hypothetical protein
MKYVRGGDFLEGEFKYCEKKMGTVIMDGKILAGNRRVIICCIHL